jgi:hypothetical protein
MKTERGWSREFQAHGINYRLEDRPGEPHLVVTGDGNDKWYVRRAGETPNLELKGVFSDEEWNSYFTDEFLKALRGVWTKRPRDYAIPKTISPTKPARFTRVKR